MSDWETDDETDLIWDQYGITLERETPKKWNIYPWEKNLRVMNRGNQLKKFDGKYNLPEQANIHNDSKQLVEKLKLSNDEKYSVISTLEQLITVYCKQKKLQYKSNNGWMNLIVTFILLKQPAAIIYNLFETIQSQYIIRDYTVVDKILYLLLFYHDPELALFLKLKVVSFENFSKKWMKTLFAGSCSHQVVTSIWRHYFSRELREPDPIFILFLVISIVIKNRDIILQKKNDEEDEEVILTPFLSSLPNKLKPKDVTPLCSAAEEFRLKTPTSAREEFYQILFSDASIASKLPELPCLYVLPSEVNIETDEIYAHQPLQPIKYFVIDCRPANQFEAGHLPSAYNLDYSLHYRNPSLFASYVDEIVNLDETKKAEDPYAREIHLCFMGSGNEEIDEIVILIAASIIKAHAKHVSILKLGYAGVHDCYEDSINCELMDHDEKRCPICKSKVVEPNLEQSGRGMTILKRIGSVLKCVKREPGEDDNEEGYSLGVVECPRGKLQFEIVSIENYKKKLKIINTYECKHINVYKDEQYNSLLILTDYNIILLRIVKNHPHAAYITSIHRFSSLLKIRASKDDMNVLTLEYGERVGDHVKIDEKYRIRVDNGVQIAEIVENQVYVDARRLRTSSRAGQ